MSFQMSNVKDVSYTKPAGLEASLKGGEGRRDEERYGWVERGREGGVFALQQHTCPVVDAQGAVKARNGGMSK